jgi:hypothetical protein
VCLVLTSILDTKERVRCWWLRANLSGRPGYSPLHPFPLISVRMSVLFPGSDLKNCFPFPHGCTKKHKKASRPPFWNARVHVYLIRLVRSFDSSLGIVQWMTWSGSERKKPGPSDKAFLGMTRTVCCPDRHNVPVASHTSATISRTALLFPSCVLSSTTWAFLFFLSFCLFFFFFFWWYWVWTQGLTWANALSPFLL